MSIEVRRSNPADAEALARLLDGYRQFYGQPADPERARRFIDERLAANDTILFLAFDDALGDGDPLGFAQLIPGFSSVHTGLLWNLNDLYVDPSGRQRGVARALLAACVAHGEQTGAVGLHLETQSTNTVAQALYLEQGWEADEEFCVYHYPLGDQQ